MYKSKSKSRRYPKRSNKHKYTRRRRTQKNKKNMFSVPSLFAQQVNR
jgi:hypothetical protein